MGRVYSDAERLLQAADLSNRGHHNKAAGIYQKMGNEVRNPAQKNSCGIWRKIQGAKAHNTRIKLEKAMSIQENKKSVYPDDVMEWTYCPYCSHEIQAYTGGNER